MENKKEILNARRRLENRKGQKVQLEQIVEGMEEVLRKKRINARRHEQALEIVKKVGLATQKELEYHLAEQVSLAMEAVFDDPYKLKVHFQEKRGKTEAELLFTRRGLEFFPLGSAGGGCIDVASLALRMAYWSMRQDRKTRASFLLDEPFSQLKGEDANQRVLGIVQELSQKLNLQILSISDERVSKEEILNNADRVFLITKGEKGASGIKVLKAEE